MRLKLFFDQPWTSEQALGWEKTRAKGRFRFIVFYGGFVWASGVIFFLNALHIFVLRDPFEGKYLIISLSVWPVAGMLIYSLAWLRCEASYRKFKRGENGDRQS